MTVVSIAASEAMSFLLSAITQLTQIRKTRKKHIRMHYYEISPAFSPIPELVAQKSDTFSWSYSGGILPIAKIQCNLMRKKHCGQCHVLGLLWETLAGCVFISSEHQHYKILDTFYLLEWTEKKTLSMKDMN